MEATSVKKKLSTERHKKSGRVATRTTKRGDPFVLKKRQTER